VPRPSGAMFSSRWKRLAVAQRAGMAVLREPFPDAAAVEVVFTLQGHDLVVFIEGAEADRALATHEVLRCDVGQTIHTFRAGSLLRDSIIQAEKHLVVLGPNVTRKEAVDFHRRQAARQDRVRLIVEVAKAAAAGLHVRVALVRPPAVVAAMRGLARMTVTVVGAVAVVLAVVAAMVAVVTVVVAVAVAGAGGAPVVKSFILST